MAFPQNVKENLSDVLGIDPRICCLVDVKRWPRLLKPMEHLLPMQLTEANVVLMNKTDLVSGEELSSVRESVESFCGADTRIYEVSLVSGIDAGILGDILGIGE